MINNNFNGQNGVATSAMIENAVAKAVKMINKAENAKRGYVKIGEDMRLSFDGARFFKGPKHYFIFNGKIEKKCSNGRYDQVFVEFHYKNLDNEEAFWDTKMVNVVLGAILDKIDNWIMNYYKSDFNSKWEAGLELYQNFRNEHFGSRLIVDNSENLNSTDSLDNDIESVTFDGFENASDECDGSMMACVDKYGQEFIDAVIKEYADTVYNAVSDYELYFEDTIKYCVNGALDYMGYDPEKKRLVGCSLVPDIYDWDDENVFCEYFMDTYDFDWDSCQEFYQEYCNDIWHFADEYGDRMVEALKDFDNGAVYDKIPCEIEYNEDYINVYIDMDNFVDYIKKNMVFNDSMAQLFKYENLGLKFDNENIEQFYNDLIAMAPVVTDAKLYDDGLYLWYDDITIRKFFEKQKIYGGISLEKNV